MTNRPNAEADNGGPTRNSLGDHWPTAEERERFERKGYLVVPDALSPQQVEHLSATIDRLGHGEGGFFNRLDILGLDEAFLSLVDNTPVLAKIAGFLGWNIWVNHTHYNVRPPDQTPEQYPYMWHQDGGTFSLDLQGNAPMTAIKVGFYLTDLSTPNRGQTFIIPRSSAGASGRDEELGRITPPPAHAVPLEVRPGTAVLFQQRTIHSQGSPNLSDTIRRTIFVQWAYRWLFPVDTMTLGDLEPRVEDPVRRQMLGFDPVRPEGKLSAKYYPRIEDIPLKALLVKQVGIGRLCELGPAATRHLTRFLKFE